MLEGKEHKRLKAVAITILKYLGSEKIVEEGYGNVDVAGSVFGKSIAFECGGTSKLKIEALKSRFDIVVHLPYCYTPELVMPLKEIKKRLESEVVAHG